MNDQHVNDQKTLGLILSTWRWAHDEGSILCVRTTTDSVKLSLPGKVTCKV